MLQILSHCFLADKHSIVAQPSFIEKSEEICDHERSKETGESFLLWFEDFRVDTVFDSHRNTNIVVHHDEWQRDVHHEDSNLKLFHVTLPVIITGVLISFWGLIFRNCNKVPYTGKQCNTIEQRSNHPHRASFLPIGHVGAKKTFTAHLFVRFERWDTLS